MKNEQDNDFPIHSAHRSLPVVHVCLSGRSDSYHEFLKVESLTASTSTWSFYGLQNYFKILRNAGFISSMKKHGDDLAGRRHHYHVPVHVDGRDFDQWHPRRKILQGRHLYAPISSAPWHWPPCGFSMCSTMIMVC